MFKVVRDILNSREFSVVERFNLPERSARYAPIPRFLFDSRTGLYLDRQSESRQQKGKLWVHQAQALEALGREENVVVSTGTASGKSLVFRSLAFHKTLLDPGNRTLVFYPLKALATDQVHGWKEMASALGLGAHIIGRIDGSVQSQEREDVLRSARIVVMTPDVCQAWLMSRLSLPVVRNFVRDLSTVVMDEAHTLEGVFGSNFAFLIRRLIAARSHLIQDTTEAPPLQIVAATATIKNPGEHMTQLTGAEFSIVSHETDGAPQHKRLIAHIGCPSGEETQVAKALHDRMLDNARDGGFITFLDSRKGVEGLAMASDGQSDEMLDRTDVLPYRAGYDVEDRQLIERRLQSGKLRGIVSTSALELGIDIPHLRVGLNIGVPGTRKAYRQRLGRIGRSSPGAFVVIAPPRAFRGYGTSFREYHEMSVEPSYLYLDNRFMQFAHGRCLAVEQESLGAPSKTPSRGTWPDGFRNMHAAARPGGNRPQQYDAIAALGGDTPHYGYPLRNVGEASFQIKMHVEGNSIGNVNQLQALRECYPGATYLHLKKAYEIAAWHTNSFESFIRVKRAPPGRSTQPRITTWVNAGVTSADIQENYIVKSQHGFLAECLMQITQRVEGYVDGTGEFHSYKELQQRNPNMRARSRNFRTTGVVLCINRDWFKKTSSKMAFADRLREVFVREYSVAPQDVGSAASNISIRSLNGGGRQGGCVAIYDETYGSLRLTERLYLEFKHVLDRLLTAVVADSIDGEEDIKSIVTRIQDEISNATAGGATQETIVDVPTGYERVFKAGSRVCYQQTGQLAVDAEIIQPTIMNGNLMYQVAIVPRPGQRPVKNWISASAIEPSAVADAWEYAWWNRETWEYEDPSDDSEM